MGFTLVCICLATCLLRSGAVNLNKEISLSLSVCNFVSHIKSWCKVINKSKTVWVITVWKWIINKYQFIETLGPCFLQQNQFLCTEEHVIKNKTAQSRLVVTMLHSFLLAIFFFLQGEGSAPLSAVQCGIFSSFFSPLYYCLYKRMCKYGVTEKLIVALFCPAWPFSH